jgi:hypothetical protein
MEKRNPNLYNLIGFDRNSHVEFIEERLALAQTCDLEVTEEACSMFSIPDGKRLNATEIEQIRFIFVKKPYLRELYDKTEIFIRKPLEKTYHNPSQGSRYLSAFKDLASFSMFMIIMAFYVEKYQNFCKQVVIGSLLFFATIAFQLKVPKEGDEENQIV